MIKNKDVIQQRNHKEFKKILGKIYPNRKMPDATMQICIDIYNGKDLLKLMKENEKKNKKFFKDW